MLLLEIVKNREQEIESYISSHKYRPGRRNPGLKPKNLLKLLRLTTWDCADTGRSMSMEPWPAPVRQRCPMHRVRERVRNELIIYFAIVLTLYILLVSTQLAYVTLTFYYSLMHGERKHECIKGFEERQEAFYYLTCPTFGALLRLIGLDDRRMCEPTSSIRWEKDFFWYALYRACRLTVWYKPYSSLFLVVIVLIREKYMLHRVPSNKIKRFLYYKLPTFCVVVEYISIMGLVKQFRSTSA